APAHPAVSPFLQSPPEGAPARQGARSPRRRSLPRTTLRNVLTPGGGDAELLGWPRGVAPGILVSGPVVAGEVKALVSKPPTQSGCAGGGRLWRIFWGWVTPSLGGVVGGACVVCKDFVKPASGRGHRNSRGAQAC